MQILPAEPRRVFNMNLNQMKFPDDSDEKV